MSYSCSTFVTPIYHVLVPFTVCPQRKKVRIKKMRQWVHLVAALLDPYCHLEVFLAHVTCHFFSGKSASGRTSEEGGETLNRNLNWG